jgi:hypothetical protein
MKGNANPDRAAHLIILDLSDRSLILQLTKNTITYALMFWVEEEILKAESLSLTTMDVYVINEISVGYANQ